jgi:uncharacterized protein (DUF924 family)
MCNRGIGLVSHRVGWFDKRVACSKKCRADFVADLKRSRYLAWRRTVASWLAAHLLLQVREAGPLRAQVRLRIGSR